MEDSTSRSATTLVDRLASFAKREDLTEEEHAIMFPQRLDETQHEGRV